MTSSDISQTQQGKVQGGGTLLRGEHQRGHALIHQGLHVLNGGAEGGGAVRHVQRQDAALLPGGVKDLTAQQALDGVPGFGGFCLVSGDQHDVALNGVTLRCAVAAVGGIGLAHGNVAAVQRDLALKHHAFVLRGQVACNNGVIGGSRSGRLLGKCADAHGDGKGQHQGCGNGLTAQHCIQNLHKKYTSCTMDEKPPVL